MELTCSNCGCKFEPSKLEGKEYKIIAVTYPCPECREIVRNHATGGN